MINLARRDIEHTLGKFVVTAMGVGMLLGIVLIMIGVYRGLIVEAEVLLDDINADLWIVQENTMGPFAESSRVYEDFKDIIYVMRGIDKSEAMTFQNIQLPHKDKPVRAVAVGYDIYGKISPINPNRLIEGRELKNDHYEIVVTNKSGFKLNDKIKLGRNFYTVVGVTHKSVYSNGDPLVYISLKDAQELQFLYSNKEIQNNTARGVKNSDSVLVNAIVATVKPGFNINEVANEIKKWQHKSVYTAKEQKEILTKNLVERSSKQIGLFTIILVVVSTIIIALIIYTMTLEKMKEISIMKLMGLPNSLIVSMIVKETLILGIFAFVFGNIFSHLTYDKFPKLVVLYAYDALLLFGVIVVASVLASFVGVKKVISADPAAAIGG
ncbi:MAG: ABC transporter permease [Sulfurimonas sp. RIFOXYD12_FULL_33_39]|uniref:ABC transporter permease n=1 Tax=unclassified Sulfurimonas TaxID=2623549 RepID=UPI0008BDE184|nr:MULTISPECIES: ABC transporter permease [unclassified Sulfurimonas]OHE10089.1 MAG: ABC transporter permease [Sulfurimonas sp. RIFOXYD12_FULL_33_39]OHE14690.1 MAG: ABC transporter permease [Sulfurimonas sp. RIFOXYD2_FULL_34_21]DAB28779.1 MAG TPA: ABC transporter permease [Sulfurimonas sp. UBA10385]